MSTAQQAFAFNSSDWTAWLFEPDDPALAEFWTKVRDRSRAHPDELAGFLTNPEKRSGLLSMVATDLNGNDGHANLTLRQFLAGDGTDVGEVVETFLSSLMSMSPDDATLAASLVHVERLVFDLSDEDEVALLKHAYAEMGQPVDLSTDVDAETETFLEAACPARLELTADAKVEVQAAADTSKPVTFSINGYTGAVMNVAGFASPIIVDLTGLKPQSQRIPVLRGHSVDRVIGQTDSVTVDAMGARMTGKVMGNGADAQEFVALSKDGFSWQASIGADVVRREFLAAPNKATVNGREVTGPMVIARETALKEISVVPIGADGATSASVAAAAAI